VVVPDTPAPAPGRASFDAVLIAASQGGLRACRTLVSALPADFPAAIVFAQHRPVARADTLVELLSHWTALDVRGARQGAALAAGTLTVARADLETHVSAERRIVLRPGLPALHLADDLFASAADAYGTRALGIVLTGRLSDGAAGVCALKRRGGRVIVQDPATAEQASMPASAVATGCVDAVLDLPGIAAALRALAES
jgi:two-component system chemotaxis response regulator CheB